MNVKIYRKVLVFVILLSLVLPSFAFGEKVPKEIKRVVNRGYLGQGGLNLDKDINRAEFATVAVRLMGLEKEAKSYSGKSSFKDVNKFQGGWAVGYTTIADREGVMRGVGDSSFNPKGKITYVEMMTVFMRILGYEDGIDFVDYPDEYYEKGLELGLGQVHKKANDKVTRGEVAIIIERILDMKMKDKDIILIDKLDDVPIVVEVEEDIYMTDMSFNTNITGLFSGKLKGTNDFAGYKIELLSSSGKIYDSTFASKDGKFKIWDFDIGYLSKLEGYKYKVYDGNGKIVLDGQL
ncbi:S-layer homology domain-containing protein [Anaerosalibacter sp. Marseille-P3206]|uniref:S-layer homology domain-containing protein n=1 Tax=Anaerosalibacter sp. Marseille-P3206 TaxID=1871005 RepID=UPI000985ADC0|nr:S-layer homology domain-containing protein [Anaerosalibacter sp. Marseille-P3206]